MTPPQTKEHLRPPEAGRGRKGAPQNFQKEHAPADAEEWAGQAWGVLREVIQATLPLSARVSSWSQNGCWQSKHHIHILGRQRRESCWWLGPRPS